MLPKSGVTLDPIAAFGLVGRTAAGVKGRGACGLTDLIYIGRPVVETAGSRAKTKESVTNATVGS